jgi:hypothetical protein
MQASQSEPPVPGLLLETLSLGSSFLRRYMCATVYVHVYMCATVHSSKYGRNVRAPIRHMRSYRGKTYIIRFPVFCSFKGFNPGKVGHVYSSKEGKGAMGQSRLKCDMALGKQGKESTAYKVATAEIKLEYACLFKSATSCRQLKQRK